MSNLSLCSGISFAIVLIVRNKVNDSRVSRDSLVKYKSFFNRHCPRRRRRGFVNSLMLKQDSTVETDCLLIDTIVSPRLIN